MENFDQQPKMKEKEMYRLNLDTPRVIIMVAVIVGIVAISFLVGMNFVNQQDGATNLITSNSTIDNNKEMNLFSKNIPAPPHSNDDLSDDVEKNNQIGEDRINQKTDDLGENNLEEKKSDKIAKNNEEVLTNDDIKEIIPPKRVHKRKKIKISTRKIIKKKHVAKKIKRKSKIYAKKKKRSKVVPVSLQYKISKNRTALKHYFSVQVVSYDVKQKAEREALKLKKMNFNAYITSKNVNGRMFFRVRIGPIYSKSKAIKLLSDVQSNSRYRSSYMLKK